MPWYFYDSNGNQLTKQRGTLAVTDGGTGVASITDGGVLLGSGTSAITAMGVLADGAMIVGDGTTDPVAETGTALRTSIGVGTGDSPQFTNTTLTNDLLINTGGIINFNSGDMTITHGSNILTVAGGTFATAALTTSTIVASGEVTGTTIEATGDTAADDNAAMGYTSAEGLILTGQGSTNDITIKNDADATVISIPTGTTGVTFAGTTTLRSIAYTWPASDVAGSLRSDGSGALTWTAVSAGVGLGLVIALGG